MKSLNFKAMALTCLIAAAPTAQAGFMGILDNVMATINPNAGLTGPIYRHETKKQDKYGDELAKILLSQAHNVAKRFLEEGNPKAYNAFMVLALTVPNQEGLMVHFREVPADKDYCRDKRSEGKKIASTKAKKQFQETLNNRGLLRDRSNGFLVTCKKMGEVNTYRQLIVGGADGSDVGIMQLSALWHYEEFLKEVKYASVKSTVRYGLSYLMRRFKANYRAFPDGTYSHCLKNEDGSMNYQNLVRGSWSAYNGGPAQFCRFSDETSAHAGKDKGFVGNLNKTLNLNDGGIFGYNDDGSLPLSEEAKAALSEVVSNFENGTNNRAALESFIK